MTSSTSRAPRPRPRAGGSTSSVRSFAVVGVVVDAQDGAGARHRAYSAIQAGRWRGSKSATMLATSRSKLVVPAVLLGVEGAVALDQPAEVAGAGSADDDRAAACSIAGRRQIVRHGAHEPALVVLGERCPAGRRPPPPSAWSSVCEGLPARGGEPDRWRRASSGERSRVEQAGRLERGRAGG